MKAQLFFTLILSNLLLGFSQVGIGTSNPSQSAILEVRSNTKGFLPPRLTENEKQAIINPAAGLLIFNSTKKCLEFNKQEAIHQWQGIGCPSVNNSNTNGSSNAVSILLSYKSIGILTENQEILTNSVKQILEIDVSQIGSFNFEAVSAGITFSASGEFTTTGPQLVELIASGTPNISNLSGELFTLNTNLTNNSFSRILLPEPTGPDNCNDNNILYQSNLMVQNSNASNTTQTITVNPNAPGPYSFTTQNVFGVTFSATGVFTSAGTKNITLQASGTESGSSGSTFNSFNVTGSYPGESNFSCSFERTFWPDCTGVNFVIPLTQNYIEGTGSVDLNSLVNLTTLPAGWNIQWWRYTGTGISGQIGNIDYGLLSGEITKSNFDLGDANRELIVTEAGVYVPFLISTNTINCWTTNSNKIFVTIN